MDLESIIGLEIHVQLKTKSKMFCSCSNVFGDAKPNSAICPICMGYPGTLPVPNREAIDWTQVIGAALNCELARESKFDRKSYFYPDLPKGYQISQYDKPFSTKGVLSIVIHDSVRSIGITRVHLEEDAAKNIHTEAGNYTLVDFNRAGTPLVEIVTEPDIRSAAEAKLFLQELQKIVRALRVSDADMEKGQMRCDANISLRPVGDRTFYPKTEIKNINSFRFVERALASEIVRQSKMWEDNQIPQNTTRGFDSDRGTTVLHREKEEAADYRYFPEPDIPPFVFDQAHIDRIRSRVPELPSSRKARFVEQYAISGEQTDLILEDEMLAALFENTVSELEQLDKERVEVSSAEVPGLVRAAVTLIVRDVREVLRDAHTVGQGIGGMTAENLAELIVLIHRGLVNRSSAVKVLSEMHRTGGDPDAIIQNLGLEQVRDEGSLNHFIEDVIQQNPEIVKKITKGKKAALQFLMGQVMAKSDGKAEPGKVIELLKLRILGRSKD